MSTDDCTPFASPLKSDHLLFLKSYRKFWALSASNRANEKHYLKKRMRSTTLSLLLLGTLWSGIATAQTPVLDAWIRNTTGLTASYWENANGSPTNPQFVFHTTADSANVLSVCYNTDWVYIRSDGMTTDMGQFLNPGSPSAQDYVFSFPRNPMAASSPVEVPIVFSVGVLINGIPAFGNSDATSWSGQSQTNSAQGQHIWNVDAWYAEGFTLDTAFSAHPQQAGAYHSHATPHRLYDFPSSSHSPIVGFAFDGYPIYGPYGYSDPNNASSAITRIESSYQLRNITQRHTLPDGSPLQPQDFGPNVSGTHPLGEYIEDYEYVAGLGDLDENNGRTCVTPEYPGGTYAYFVTTDVNGDPAYPYYLGAEYHGILDDDNLNPQATITIPSGVTCITGATSMLDARENIQVIAAPSVVHDAFTLSWGNARIDRLYITDASGRVILDHAQPKNGTLEITTTAWATGVYQCVLWTGSQSHPLRIVVQH